MRFGVVEGVLDDAVHWEGQRGHHKYAAYEPGLHFARVVSIQLVDEHRQHDHDRDRVQYEACDRDQLLEIHFIHLKMKSLLINDNDKEFHVIIINS